jgi:hypothetical protein
LLPSRRALRAGAITLDELIASLVWLLRDKPRELQSLLHRRDQLCRELLCDLRRVCDEAEAGNQELKEIGVGLH